MSLITLSTLTDVRIPHCGDIPQPMCVGRNIFIQGYVRSKTAGWAINLQCGRESFPVVDAALHFNPRPSEGCVVRNSHEGGRWKTEERAGGFPFKTDQMFEVIILVEKDCYKIAVNGQHFTEFRHRIPISRVTTLTITEGVSINTIRYDNPMPAMPQRPLMPPMPPMPPSLPNYAPVMQPIFNPVIPFTGDIPPPVSGGKQICIHGVSPREHRRWSINLQCGKQDYNIALHFNPRHDEGCIVRNSKHNGTWRDEERFGGFPFTAGQTFEVLILIEHDKYKMAVNGQHFADFHHRMPLSQVDTLRIVGEVNIAMIRYDNPMHHNPPHPVIPAMPEVYGQQPIFNPVCPFRMKIPGGLFPGRMVLICGRPNDRFSINLCKGHDYLFHFDVRLKYNVDTEVIVRNSKFNGTWGVEERNISHFPFQRNVPFQIILLVEKDCCKVAVNNQHFLSYNLRVKSGLTEYDTFTVEGDAILDQIRFQ